MCIIVGAFSKTHQTVTDTVVRMLRAVTKDFPRLDRVELNLQSRCFELCPIEESRIASFPASPIALGVAYSSSYEPSCLVIGDPKSRFAALSGRIFNQREAPATLLHLLEMNLDTTGSMEAASKKLIESLDGQYALALRWGDIVLLARDSVGVKPLYLAEDDHLTAFSSRRRALSIVGLKSRRSISQPTLVSDSGIKAINTSMKIEPIRLEAKEIVESLAAILSQNLTKMLAGQNRIGILFSGGLDSSIIAKLSKDLGAECTLYCAGTSSSRDMVNAKRMSLALGMKLVQKEISYEEVAEHVSNVVRLVESTDMIRVSTSLPIFFGVMESAKAGERIMLHGQGADELYGGYERYESTLTRVGYSAVCSDMLDDVKKLARIMPEYDQIGASGSVELLAPFLDASVLRFSLGIPIQLKLHKEGLRVTRKYILRQVASRIGIPTDLLPKQKVAAQFGSGVARIMDKIARRAGFSDRVAKASGFALPVQAYLERVGQLAGLPSENE
jgi:asparagine synthase (glutamine-hydrolysing)